MALHMDVDRVRKTWYSPSPLRWMPPFQLLVENIRNETYMRL